MAYRDLLERKLKECITCLDSLLGPAEEWHVGHMGDFDTLVTVAEGTLLQISGKAVKEAREQLQEASCFLQRNNPLEQPLSTTSTKLLDS